MKSLRDILCCYDLGLGIIYYWIKILVVVLFVILVNRPSYHCKLLDCGFHVGLMLLISDDSNINIILF